MTKAQVVPIPVLKVQVKIVQIVPTLIQHLQAKIETQKEVLLVSAVGYPRYPSQEPSQRVDHCEY